MCGQKSFLQLKGENLGNNNLWVGISHFTLIQNYSIMQWYINYVYKWYIKSIYA